MTDEPGKVIQKWADVAMWSAPKHEDPQHPKVTLTMAPPDPLGIMAMINGQYTGKVYSSPTQVSDDERREAWEAATVSMLSETPMEWFQVSLLFENVTRAFTHQLVRTRLATFAQESMRFAVKEDMKDAVKLPPSIANTEQQYLEMEDEARRLFGSNPEESWPAQAAAWRNDQFARLPKEEQWRGKWDRAMERIGRTYEQLVEDGMPAEDARGLLPTNILTRIHMRVDIKTLIRMAGMRLCTQAQMEWKEVFAQVARAFREFEPLGNVPNYDGYDDDLYKWQYGLISKSFKPVCYQANKCTMKARSDRHCSIRGRVDAFEDAGVKSDEWGFEHNNNGIRLDSIQPVEWLADPEAARQRF